MASGRARFMVQVACPHCGQTGTMVWEEDDGLTPGPKGRRRLVSTATGFHPEHGRTDSGDPLVICDVCDEIQDD